jgi:hypothetical protein
MTPPSSGRGDAGYGSKYPQNQLRVDIEENML